MKNTINRLFLTVGVIFVGGSLLSACAPAPIPVYRDETPFRPYTPPRPPIEWPSETAGIPPLPTRTLPPRQIPKTISKPQMQDVPISGGFENQDMLKSDPLDAEEVLEEVVRKRPPKPYQTSEPVKILLGQADKQAANGKSGMAEATIERALRIEPDNPGLWMKLSDLKRQQGDSAQAKAMAEKAAYYQESLN